MYLLNAFSLSMVPAWCRIEVQPLLLDQVRVQDYESFIGHADTARVLSGLLDREIAVNRSNALLLPGMSAVVAQFVGARLPEGATELPKGAVLVWRLVSVYEA